MTEFIHFEDFAPQREFQSGHYRVEADRIKAFAAEFDPQPQHLDEAAASASQFGGLVASGWHTACLAMRLFVDALPPIAAGAMGTGVEHLSWIRPVRPGDDLCVVAKVLSARTSASRPEKGVVTCEVTVLNQHEETVLRFETTMLVPRDVAGGTACPPVRAPDQDLTPKMRRELK